MIVEIKARDLIAAGWHDLRSLALEFYAQSISVNREGRAEFEHRRNCLYDITAQVVFK